MQVPSDLASQYKEALVAGAKLAPPSEHDLYSLHLREFDLLCSLVDSGAPSETIAAKISSERRAFGWSYLSGTHGERAETAFHAFAAALESQ
ncbi:MAG: hypothetical protein Q7K57_27295 [Burkholderiaceae bacterium]|nr:hypothetical protein [Burkholderiaceae bacterium]